MTMRIVYILTLSWPYPFKLISPQHDQSVLGKKLCCENVSNYYKYGGCGQEQLLKADCHASWDFVMGSA